MYEEWRGGEGRAKGGGEASPPEAETFLWELNSDPAQYDLKDMWPPPPFPILLQGLFIFDPFPPPPQ